MRHLFRTVFSGSFPRRHFFLASCTAGILAIALYIPTPEVSAKRTEVPLTIEVSQPDPDNFDLKTEIATALAKTEKALAIAETVPEPDNIALKKPETETPTPEPKSNKQNKTPIETTLALSQQKARQTQEPKTAEPQTRKTDKGSLSETVNGIKWRHVTIKSGDNLSELFQNQGFNASHVHRIASSGPHGKGLSWIKPGQQLSFGTDNKGQLAELKHVRNKLETAHFTYKNGKFHARMLTRSPEIVTLGAAGKIIDALYIAGQKAGLPDRITMRLADIFAWDIDFALDIREGDSFRVLYEEHRLDGKRIGYGDILIAEFTNQGDRYRAVRYTNSKGKTAYYSTDGKSLRKAFLRTPVEFARISSHFNLKRRHPVLNKIRAHKGVDYAAPHGTSIKTVGDGKIIFAGKKGGYGNVVIIQHGQRYQTLYAHMRGFARGIRQGKEVLQGQVIGYVGMTGLATGPHLHYEFRVNGNHVNPVTVKFPNASPIASAEMSRFKKHSGQLLANLDKSSPKMLASSK